MRNSITACLLALIATYSLATENAGDTASKYTKRPDQGTTIAYVDYVNLTATNKQYSTRITSTERSFEVNRFNKVINHNVRIGLDRLIDERLSQDFLPNLAPSE
jgi:hypothetical protein